MIKSFKKQHGDVLVRTATSDDAPTIAAFNIAMALETEDLQLDTAKVNAGVSGVFEQPSRGFYLVTEVAQQLTGCLMVTREWSDWRNGEFWWIQSVYVDPAHRGQGQYSLLYDTVKTVANEWSEAPVCGFRLYVEKDNQRAQKTYQRQGMHETYYLIFEEEIPQNDQ